MAPRSESPQLQRLLARLESLGAVTREGKSFRATCPLHRGRSLIISAGTRQAVVLKCMGSADCSTEAILGALGMSIRDLHADAASSGDGATSPGPLPKSKVIARWQRALLRSRRAYEYLTNERGIDPNTIRRHRIGFDGERIMMPIFDSGRLVNVRCYHPALEPKIKGLPGRGTQLWIPKGSALHDQGWVLLCEGELDTLVALQHGLPAATGTGGARTWKSGWNSPLTGLHVVIAYDCDEAGRAGAELVAKSCWSNAASVRIVNLRLGDGEDISDWFVKYGKSAKNLRTLIRKTPEWLPSARDRVVDGATFIFSQPKEVPAIWGAGDDVLWAEDEACMIAGPQGVGKTTLAQQIVFAIIGVRDAEVLGYPVAQRAGRVLYLAMDRPAQAARSMLRMVKPSQRRRLRKRLIVWRGPLEFDPVVNPRGLPDLAVGLDATTVVVDSLKDLAPRLTQDEVGSAFNSAVQEMVARGIQVLVLHHQRKAQGDNNRPDTLADVYGSTWLTAGMGSVILLWGQPGGRVVELRHLKQPVDPVGPLRVVHIHHAGISQVEDHRKALLELAAEAGEDGITEADAALRLFGNDTAADKKRTRRLLEKLVGRELRYVPGKKGGRGGGGRAARWFADPRAQANQSRRARNPNTTPA